MNRRTLFTYGAAISGALALTLFIGWWRVDGPGAPEPVAQRPLPLTQMDFQMTDQGGATVGPASLLGNPSMVFFGFTYCPDVCPTTLSDISGWLDDVAKSYCSSNKVLYPRLAASMAVPRPEAPPPMIRISQGSFWVCMLWMFLARFIFC